MNFEALQKTYLSEIETAVKANLPDGEQYKVVEAMKYASDGGKRVRGVLTLAFADLLGGHNQDTVNAACALEFIHAYSLIHDDLPCMDNDDMRRGKPSCHKAYGEAVALLAGDALLTLAFGVAGKLKNGGECASILSQSAGWRGMIGGQELDLSAENAKISYEQLLEIHGKKTGALFRACAQLACATTGQKSDDIVSFASDIGLVFQIVDDVLDAEETTDICNKKTVTTFVTLFGTEKAAETANEITKKAVDMLYAEYGDKSSFLCEYASRLANRLK